MARNRPFLLHQNRGNFSDGQVPVRPKILNEVSVHAKKLSKKLERIAGKQSVE
ncbi:MAG: hypothetical protein IJ719_08630 [Clostridia bacterium]|nr:hypothetical protein [Clostridia bacterium]